MEAKLQITKEELLKHVSEEDIFKRYSDFQEINQKFFSPFNDEKTPSAIVYPNKFFNCFSSGKKGSCFDLVMMKFGCSFQESLLLIANDFNISKLNLEFNPIIFGIKPKKSYISKPVDIKIKSKSFTKEGLDYWNQYLINEKTLIKYEIKQLEYYWLNNKMFKLYYNQLGFAYDFYNYKYQLLFPNNTKEFKWFSNTTITDLQGFNQLPLNGDKLIITSSLKDVACLNENFNLECVAPKSENSIIPEIIIEHLKLRFKQIIIYLNNDAAGIRSSKEYEERYNLKWIINPLELDKDPSDIIKNSNKNKLIEFLKHEKILE